MKFTFEEDILIYAFRYALGRRSYSVNIVVDNIKANWDLLKPHNQKQIKHEINEYHTQHGNLGDKCDDRMWRDILDK